MSWAEFRQLLVGISPDTALGRIVAIRAENDKDILKHFSTEQHRIRNTWQIRRAKAKTARQTADYIEQLRLGFIKMAGKDIG